MSQGKNDPVNLHLTVELKLPGVFQNKRHLANVADSCFFFFLLLCWVEKHNIYGRYAVFSAAAPSLWLILGCRESGREGKLLTTFPLFMMSSGETVFGVKSTGRDTASWCSAHSGIFFFFPAVSSTEMQVFLLRGRCLSFARANRKHSVGVLARWRQLMASSGGAGRCRRGVTVTGRLRAIDRIDWFSHSLKLTRNLWT